MFRDADLPTLLVLSLALVAATAVVMGVGRHSTSGAVRTAVGQEVPAAQFEGVGDRALRSALEEVREATREFADVKVAKEAGYVRDPMDLCLEASDMGLPSQLGAMGVHYIRPDLLGITAEKPRVDGNGTHTDFTEPAVLVYEPGAGGTMELVAVENLVFRAAWDASHSEKPSFHGLEYFPMSDNPNTRVDEVHHFRPHYELHLWVHRENAVAVFSEWNPRVSCEHHGRTGDGRAASHATGATYRSSDGAYGRIGRENLPAYWRQDDDWPEVLPPDWIR